MVEHRWLKTGVYVLHGFNSQWLLNVHFPLFYFCLTHLLTGLQVFSNPGISVCENETDRVNSVGEHTAGSERGSEMMADNTTGERNVTCVICGKPMVKVFSYQQTTFM